MSRGARLPIFKGRAKFIGGELTPGLEKTNTPRPVARATDPKADLISREAVCRRLGVSRWTLLRWVAEWKRRHSTGSTVEALVGVPGCFPPATHGCGQWKRWERAVLDAWCEAARSKG